MAEAQVTLDEGRVRALERVAAEERVSVDEVLRRAVDRLLEERAELARPWEERLDALLARVRARVPPDATPAGIEADVTANWEEDRAERAAARRRAPDAADAGGR
jgi:hypothetical protein